MKEITTLCILYVSFLQSGGHDQERKKAKHRGDLYSIQTSLIVAALKKMLPIGLNMCTPGDQELISLAKSRYSWVSQQFAIIYYRHEVFESERDKGNSNLMLVHSAC